MFRINPYSALCSILRSSRFISRWLLASSKISSNMALVTTMKRKGERGHPWRMPMCCRWIELHPKGEFDLEGWGRIDF
eukprot:5152390-Amphidinium_carterae.1